VELGDGTEGCGVTAPARKPAADLGAVLDIPIASIRPFAKQPRKRFDQAALADLMASIEAVGQQVPVTVRPLGKGDAHAYELVDGERRFRACQRLKRATIRAWVRDVTDEGEQFLASVVSNFARADHTPLEIAEAVAKLAERPDLAALGKTEQAERIGAIFGRTGSWASNFLGFRRLVPEARPFLDPEGSASIPFDALLVLSGLPPESQRTLASEILRRRLTGKAAGALIRRHRTETGLPFRAEMPSGHWHRLRSRMSGVTAVLHEYADMPISVIRSGITSRPRDEQALLLREVEAALEGLTELAQAVRRIVAEGAR
jgi:ParB family chromosome partitioning protein